MTFDTLHAFQHVAALTILNPVPHSVHLAGAVIALPRGHCTEVPPEYLTHSAMPGHVLEHADGVLAACSAVWWLCFKII